jgi:ComEC/Rec2-related protein
MPVYFPRAIGLAAAMGWFGAFSADDFASRCPYLTASAGALIFLLARKTLPFKFVLVLFAIGAIFFAYARFSKPLPTGSDLSRFNGMSALIRVELSEDPKPFGENAFSSAVDSVQIIFPRSAKLAGKALLIFSGNPINFTKGDFLEVKAVLRSPENPIEPWKFRTRDFLNRQGIFCIATTKSACTKLPPRPHSFWTTTINQCTNFAAEERRAILRIHAANIGTTYAALLQSIVLGDKTTELPQEIKSDFRHVGLSHVTAASGFNLTVVAGISYWITKLLCKSGAPTRIIPLVSILIFVMMAGPSPSVVRAALCCATFLLGAHLRRKFSPLAVLSLSVLVSLAFDPILATDVGAELSYAATFGIICFSKNMTVSSAEKENGKTIVDFAAARRWLWDSLSVLFGVQVGVLPIQLVYFWQTGLAFLPANLLAEPLIAPLTVAGFISSFLAALADGSWAPPLRHLAYWIDQFACLLIKGILLVVNAFNHFPYAVINLGPSTAPQTFSYYLAAFFLLYSLKTGRNLAPAIVVYFFGLGLLLYRPPLSEPVICVSRQLIGLVGVDHKGFYMGAPGDAEKFLAYYGCRAAPIGAPNLPGETPPLPIYDGVRTARWTIKISGNRRFLHNRRLEGDQKRQFTLFCSRGLTADVR